MKVLDAGICYRAKKRKDGGVLIGKVYGHLANEHKKAMAERMNFGPVILEKTATN